MTIPICSACGTEFPAGSNLTACPICEDERQFVNPAGQRWTSRETLSRNHKNALKEKEPGLIGIGIEPTFAIGQRALLVKTPSGNLLWDCVPLIDAATKQIIEGLGGLKAIAISHPHYYSAMVSWSEAFGNVPIHLHEDDRQWVMRPSENLNFWGGETLAILPGITAIRTGGHFAGGTVLHWAEGSGGKGALLSGDVLQVTPDSSYVSFMRSFPIYIPLSARVVQRIIDRIEPYPFDRIYGAFWGRVVPKDGKPAVARSAKRYIDAVNGKGPADGEP